MGCDVIQVLLPQSTSARRDWRVVHHSNNNLCDNHVSDGNNHVLHKHDNHGVVDNRVINHHIQYGYHNYGHIDVYHIIQRHDDHNHVNYYHYNHDNHAPSAVRFPQRV